MTVSGNRVQVEVRLHVHLFGVSAEVEAELLQDALHGAVIEEYLCVDTIQTLGAGDLEEAIQEQGADAPALEAVADEDRELRLLGDGAAAAQTGYAHDLTFPRLWIGVFGDQRHLTVVVYKADARQALVGGALVEVHHVEVAHVDALFREGLVEAHHQGFVLRPDRAYRHGRAVAQHSVGDVLFRVRTDRGSWKVFVLGLGVVQNDAGVECYEALRRGQERVDVELFDPGLLDDELARANEQPLQGADVDRRPAPDATQCLEDAGPFHHPPGERGGQRREGEGPVSVHLDQRASGPEEQDGTELRVQAASDDQLVAVEADHSLDGGAAEVLGPVVLPYGGLHLLVGPPDLVGALQVQAHAAHVGLVGYGLGVELEDHGVAEAVCQFDGLIRAVRDLRLDGRDTVGGEDLLRLELCKYGTSSVADAGYDLLYPLAVRAFLFGRLGGFVDAAQVVGVLPHVRESSGCRIGVVEGRDARAVQDRLPSRDGRSTHPARQHGLPRTVRVGCEPFRRCRRVCHVLRREDDEQPVALRVACRGLERLRVAFGIGVAEHVYRVAVAPGSREKLVQGSHRLFGYLRDFAAVTDKGVRREHRGTAGVRKDREARSLGARLFAQHLGHPEQLRDLVHTQHAAARKRCVEHLIRAGQGACMGGRRFARGLRSSGFDHYYRFGQGDFTGRREKGAGVADRLHVDDDALRIRVVAEIVDQVSPAYVHHGACADERREPDVLHKALVQDGREQSPTLA